MANCWLDTEKMAQDDDVDMTPAAASLPIDADKADPITKAVEIVDVSQSATLQNTLDNNILKIALNPEEQKLFDTIKKAAIAWSEGKLTLGTKSVEIRVAGGWVRDKILGLETHDVDIALDACTGVEFAHAVKEYHASQQDQGESSNSKNNKIGKIGVIAANPDQSKHLETACVNIFGNDVDFSNLRHETYAEDSRIPDTVMGTPLEDSFRRDATMNALYYNLNTGCIEDWTRRGLRDLLETKIINTPLKAFQTFQDDPLRVLRLIRFAVRYKMQLSEEITDACQHPGIHEQLHRKVSRERVGNELEGMLSGKHANPILAMDLICRMNLADSVFFPTKKIDIEGIICQANLRRTPYIEADSDDNELTRIRAIAWEESRECLKTLSVVLEAFSPVVNSTTTIDTRLVYLAIVLLPYMRLNYQEKSKTKTVVEFMMRDGIKFKNKDVVSMGLVSQNLIEMIKLLQYSEATFKEAMSLRLMAGLTLRSTKEMWVTTLIVATVWLSRVPGYSQDHGWCGKAIELYKTIIVTMNLDECWKTKPPMNGKELIHLLGLKRGPEVGVYMEEQVRWTLTHPNLGIEELQAHLKFFKKTREGDAPVAKKIHV